jgi:hypothetical protein
LQACPNEGITLVEVEDESKPSPLILP